MVRLQPVAPCGEKPALSALPASASKGSPALMFGQMPPGQRNGAWGVPARRAVNKQSVVCL